MDRMEKITSFDDIGNNGINLVTKLNDLKVRQTSLDWPRDMPAHVRENYFGNELKVVAVGLQPKKFDTCHVVIDILDVNGALVGVEYVNAMVKPTDNISDVQWLLRFHEMKPINMLELLCK